MLQTLFIMYLNGLLRQHKNSECGSSDHELLVGITGRSELSSVSGIQ